MKHHKKISNKKQLFPWIAILAIAIVVFFQGYSLVQYYKYLSQMLSTILDDKFGQAVEQYRTLKLKYLDTFSIKFNSEAEKESHVDARFDYKADKLSFDKLMYKITGHAIASEELNINELDSIYKADLITDNLQADYKIIVYSANTDSIIGQTTGMKSVNYQHSTLRKEIDIRREAQAFFRNPARFIFQKMFFYIILSGLMLIAVIVALVYQLRIIFKQKQIEQIRQDFTNSMIHELRNPLQGALSMAELAENDTFAHNVKRRNEVIGKIKNNLNSINQLLNSLVERSFSDRTQQVADWKSGNLSECILEIVENILISSNKPIHFTKTLSPETEHCQFDQLHLPKALINLVENAVKYSGEEVAIDITTALNGTFLSISISDNGFGIDKTDQPNIFNKFYRGSLAKQSAGFGLGLSYVLWVSKLHEGQVTVESVKGKGSRFSLIIPFKTSKS
jgi:Signal transduction histidine kinase